MCVQDTQIAKHAVDRTSAPNATKVTNSTMQLPQLLASNAIFKIVYIVLRMEFARSVRLALCLSMVGLLVGVRKGSNLPVKMPLLKGVLDVFPSTVGNVILHQILVPHAHLVLRSKTMIKLVKNVLSLYCKVELFVIVLKPRNSIQLQNNAFHAHF